jgi:hypothetical protein
MRRRITHCGSSDSTNAPAACGQEKGKSDKKCMAENMCRQKVCQKFIHRTPLLLSKIMHFTCRNLSSYFVSPCSHFSGRQLSFRNVIKLCGVNCFKLPFKTYLMVVLVCDNGFSTKGKYEKWPKVEM